MAIAFLTSTMTASTTAANPLTCTINTTSASLIVVQVAGNNTIIPSNISDSQGNAWQCLIDQSTNSSLNAPLFYAINPTVAATHTITFSCGATAFPSMAVACFSGVDTASPMDYQINTIGTAVSVSIQAGSVTPAKDNSLVISAGAWGNVTMNTLTPVNSGFTAIVQQNAANYGCAIGYLIEGTASAVNPTWTLNTATAKWVFSNTIFTTTNTTGKLITSTFAQSTNSSTATSAGINTIGANFIYVAIGNSGSVVPTNISDSLSNTYTLATSYAFGVNNALIYYSASPTVSTTHTVTVTQSAGKPCFGVAAFSGMSNSPYDKSVGTSLNIPGTLTPTNVNEILISWVAPVGTAAPLGTHSGFVSLGGAGSATAAIGGGFVWKYAASKAATSMNWNSPDAGRLSTIDAFVINTNITTTQTLPGKARIQISSSQTITGKSRLGVNVAATILGKARITASTLRTILGKAAIKATSSQTLLGKARLANTTAQTISGTSRIRTTVSQTLTGLSRIAVIPVQTITGKARMLVTTSRTIGGKAAIRNTTTQAISGLARLTRTVSQTITGKAKIFRQTNVSPARILHVMADTRQSTVVAEPREFDALKDERVYKVLE